MKNKIIFLDFDGVITNIDSNFKFNINKINLLQRILEETGAKIVVTSSKKLGCSNVDEFIDKTFNEAFINLNTPFLKSIIDITNDNFIYRGSEVSSWLRSHDGEVESYVILDDDDDYKIEQLTHFVQTDTYEGLTEREVKLAIRVLNNLSVFDITRLNQRIKFAWTLKSYTSDDSRYKFDIYEMRDKYFETIKDN